jgi:hypothetical protein
MNFKSGKISMVTKTSANLTVLDVSWPRFFDIIVPSDGNLLWIIRNHINNFKIIGII